MQVSFLNGPEWCTSWIAAEPAYMQRTSHALRLADDRVVLIDPVDGEGVGERVEQLGSVGAVIQLLDRHARDCQELARRYGAPLIELPLEPIDALPFQPIALARLPIWREVALWWPERRALVVSESLGSAAYFCAPHRPIGVHPLRRLLPPRALLPFPAEHLLVGHGRNLHGSATEEAVATAVKKARREIPAWGAKLARTALRSR